MEKKITFTDDELEILRRVLVSKSCMLEKDIEIFKDAAKFDWFYQRSLAELDFVNDLLIKIYRVM